MLIQKPDGSLWYKDGEQETPASNTDICKRYRNMQYNIDTSFGCYATDASKIIKQLIGEEKFEEYFWKLEYCEMPANCTRIK